MYMYVCMLIKCANAKLLFVYQGLVCILKLYSDILWGTVMRTFCISFSLFSPLDFTEDLS